MAMNRFFIMIPLLLAAVTSCLFENDMSYPVIPADILSFEVEGQVSCNIDKNQKTVQVVLNETADMSHLKFVSMNISEEASAVGSIPEYLDLTSPYKVYLKTYMNHEWTVTATQPISRYVKVENQVGEAEFDLENRVAVVYVSDRSLLSETRFIDVKLEPEGSVVEKTTGPVVNGVAQMQICSFPMTLDCVHMRTFFVRYKGQTYEWTLKALKKSVGQQITEIEAWTYHAVVKGTFSGQGTPSVQYRKSADQDWTTATDIMTEGVNVSVDIKGLDAGTEYSVRLQEGESASGEMSFKTDEPVQLSNMNFDDWHQDGKVFYPYLDGASVKVWDSANKATASFGGSSTTPEETFVVKGKAVRMESKYVVIAFAAGNLYTGRFCNIAGLGAELDWGYPFVNRPSALKGHYSYVPKAIDNVKAPYENMKGTMDKCQIQVILADWDMPFHINTTKGEFVDIENDPHIIAFARYESDEATDGYKEFTLPLEYRDRVRKPKYVVISAAASYLGDYFTGGEGSVMHVDEFEFIYE